MADAPADFFISRAGADREAAKAVAEIISEAGLTCFYQDKDFGPSDFMRRTEQAYACHRMVALLSPEYQQSEYCRAEYNHMLARDPGNLNKALIGLRIADYQPHGSLQNLVYTDLVPHLTDPATFRRLARVALGIETAPAEVDFAKLYRRAGQQIVHPDIRAVKGFNGREDMLEAIGSKLAEGTGTLAIRNSSQVSVAVRGLGGVGKTVLAIEYAHRNREAYHGVWWIRAEKRETLVDDLAALGTRFIQGLEALEPEKAAAKTLEQIAAGHTEKPWLLIYDNADDVALMRKWTPANNAHVLITTRVTNWHGERTNCPWMCSTVTRPLHSSCVRPATRRRPRPARQPGVSRMRSAACPCR
jgi:hypothetical protein